MIESFTPVTEGYYHVNRGDTARSVAAAVYGDQNKYAQLLKANPEDWETGDIIAVPGVTGRVDKSRKGESSASIIKRIFPNQPVHLYQSRFFVWNGGQNRQFEDSELVFLPDR